MRSPAPKTCSAPGRPSNPHRFRAVTPSRLRTVADLRRLVRAWRAEGLRIGLVPTMGALHAGHLSLVETAKGRADRVVASIFVNPTQFGAGEDLAAYPRDENGDVAKLAAAGCDAVYLPTPAAMYPDGFATTVTVARIAEGLCGTFRPTHFAGVATVVTKLLTQAQPDVAVFGEKDYQQLAVIRRLVRDLDLPVEVLGGATMREADGLAMSSRNAYLNTEERRIAPALYRELSRAAARLNGGEGTMTVLREGIQALQEAGFVEVQYLELRDAATLAPLQDMQAAEGRLLAAAMLGKTRLIDNVAVVRAGI